VHPPDPARRATLLVADPQALVCDALASLCEQAGDFEVVGRSQDGLETWQLLERRAPDLALLDLGLPRLFAAEIIRKCREAALPTRCAIIAPRSDRKAVLEALRSGGGIFVSPTLPIQSLFIPKKRTHPHEDPIESLSSREHQVFMLLVAGYRAKEIAATLDLSPKTVDTYRSNLMRKLDIRDVASLVKYAMQRNLTSGA
jgi:DNA-binding NarL/FixJ family response regulator